MKKPLKYTFIGVLLLLTLFGGCSKCKKDVNPCLGVKKANFKMFEIVKDSLFETDKALTYNYVVFQADEDYESYTWTIGDDPTIRTTKKVRVFFPEPTIPLTIRLVAKRKPRPDCIPNDDGIDTIEKTFQAVKYNDALILGKYQGFSKEGTPLVGNPLDTFTVDIYNLDKNRQPRNSSLFVADNFKKGSYVRAIISGEPAWVDYCGYRAMLWNDGFFLVGNKWYQWKKGWYVVNKTNDSLSIQGSYYYDDPKNSINIEFKGKKLN